MNKPSDMHCGSGACGQEAKPCCEPPKSKNKQAINKKRKDQLARGITMVEDEEDL